MKHLRVLAIAATALLGAATAASAQEAYTTNDVSLRAGPGTRYPAVRLVPEDSIVYIHGCLRNWDWCDVSWRYSRGWIFSDYLEGIYQNRRYGFDEWHDYVDVPYVTFGFGYWDRYYRDRPWYGSWERWGDRNDRYWMQHRRNGGGDWNSMDNNTDNTWNRTDNNTQGNRYTHRYPRYDNNNNNDNNDNNNTGEVTRCAPDDPSCYGGGNTYRHYRHNNDQQQQDDNEQ